MASMVIMIDDNEDDLLFTRIVFERSGADVNLKQFTSAQEALEFFKTTELPRPALVLLDINMPGMSGFDFLEAYEALPVDMRNSVVVVMLTSSIDDRDKERAVKFASVKGFVSKPLDRAEAGQLLKLMSTSVAF